MYSSYRLYIFFFFNDTSTTEIYTLSLHDALPIYVAVRNGAVSSKSRWRSSLQAAWESLKNNPYAGDGVPDYAVVTTERSEEHTSELQSRQYLVCRLLLEKKKKKQKIEKNTRII